MRTRPLSILLFAPLLAAGCIQQEKHDARPDAATGDGEGADGGGADAGASRSGAREDAGSQKVPSVFKAACAKEGECKAQHLCVQGVCVPKLGPTQTTVITDPDNGQPSQEPVNLDCVGKEVAELAKGLPNIKEVVMWGRVDRFGGGGLTDKVEVAVFRAGDFKPQACASIVDVEASWKCYGDESRTGSPIAKVVSIDPADAAAKGWDVTGRKYKDGDECPKGQHLLCPHGSVCDKIDNVVQCGKNHGVFAIEGIPTNTPLIIRVRATDYANPSGWHDSYLWNVVLFSDRLDDKGPGKQPTKYVGKDTYRYNPTVVGQGQWDLVPETIGVLGGITEGYGVIGGRIRDCGTKTRRSWNVRDAKVAIGVPPAGLTYFNDSETDTVPNKSRTSTNVLGRYAAVDIPPGPNRISVLGRVGDKDTVLARAEVYVIPNALVIVSTPGYNPHLNK